MEGVDKVEDDPADDDVVVETDVDDHHDRGHPDAAQVWNQFEPGPDGSLARALSDEELQVEERDAHHEEHDEIGEDEGTWEGCVCV